MHQGLPSRLFWIESACFMSSSYKTFMIESMKEIGYVSKCNPTGKLSLKRIKMIFSPVHQSSPPVQSTSPVTSPVHQSSPGPVIVDYPTLHALFGKELDCPSVVTATHTHTHHLLQNSLQPPPNHLHLGCSYHLCSGHIFPLGVWLMLKKKKHTRRSLVKFCHVSSCE